MFHVEHALRGGCLALVLITAAPSEAIAQSSPDAGKAAAPTAEKKPPEKKPVRKKSTRRTPAKPQKTAKAIKRDPRTVGLGRSCVKRGDCSSKAQVCLREHDQRGQLLPKGLCALPCAGLEQGLTKTRPGFPARDRETTERILERKPPPRCPAKFQCRTAGAGVPIDICVKG